MTGLEIVAALIVFALAGLGVVVGWRYLKSHWNKTG